jgi:hypothetical protein
MISMQRADKGLVTGVLKAEWHVDVESAAFAAAGVCHGTCVRDSAQAE